MRSFLGRLHKLERVFFSFNQKRNNNKKNPPKAKSQEKSKCVLRRDVKSTRHLVIWGLADICVLCVLLKKKKEDILVP